VTRSLWIRLTLFSLLVVFSVSALLFSPLREFIEPKQLFDALGQIREHSAAPILFVVGFLLLSLLGSPLVPLIVAGAAVFGFGRGVALNYVGVLLGASCSYWLARLLGRDVFRHVLGSRYMTMESLIQRRGFWPMVRLRFLPVPFPVVNYGSALLGVGYPLFLTSTALAYVPILIVYSYFAATVVRVGESEREVILHRLALSIVALLLLTFLPPWIRSWRNGRWKRHRHVKNGADGRYTRRPSTDRATPR
jgi:uncharacterized membrane protein YdjX (TVP38/TMEM64 family)